MLSKNIKDTEEIAKIFLDKILRDENKKSGATVVALSGDLGAGKTTFTQAVGKHLGIKNKIASPTFVLIKKYLIPLPLLRGSAQRARGSHFKFLFHLDAYRLKNEKELLALGWEEIIGDKEHLVFIEWPENVTKIIPKNAKYICISHLENNHRKLELSAKGGSTSGGKVKNIWNEENLINVLRKGGVVIMPTDTIYGMVGLAENENTVNRIYEIRKRNPSKPCIVLIGDISELEKFSVFPTLEQKNIIKNFSRPTSFILDCPGEQFAYLYRGTKTLAFRLPSSKELRDLLLQTGPLIAPSANLETIPPSENVEDAKKYFGGLVDLYIDGGTIHNKASKLIKLNKDGSVIVIRE